MTRVRSEESLERQRHACIRNAMLLRCYDPTSFKWPRYGGRGIKVCARWKNKRTGFHAFLADMGLRPSRSHTLDRKNNDGDYSPENCRWTTQTQQQRNRGNNKMVTVGEQTMTIAEWAEASGLPPKTVSRRLRDGWSP